MDLSSCRPLYPFKSHWLDVKGHRYHYLDEGAGDLEADRALRTALRETAQGATILVITHRLSTLGTVDRIFVLDEGRVTEQESVAELS